MGRVIPLRRAALDLCPPPLLLACTLILVIAGLNPSSLATPAPSPIPGNTTDQLALLSFRSLIHDPSGALASWNSTRHFCLWRGVTCGGRRHPQRVVAIDLENLGLMGTLSPSLANLTFLRRLHLPQNHLSGHVLPEFGRLLRLQHLSLTYNSLAGEIPANLSYCANLRNLTISKNMITGVIPTELSSLPRLERLSLSYNMISGRIPPAMGNLSSVLLLYLGENRLGGSIPPELARLKGLQYLGVGANLLSGTIPPSLYNVSTLRRLEVSNNNLSGTLPPNLGSTLPQLEVLYMYYNEFGGHLPPSFPNASRLINIQIFANNFVGVIPSNLGALQDLSSLLLGVNQLEAADWSFLSALTNCSQLQWLGLQGNNLQGTLPTTIANLSTQLQVLTIAYNEISGGIPSGIGNLVNLVAMSMGSNLLTSTIPDTIGSLGGLLTLTLSSNKLSGEIPASLGNITLMSNLWLHNNDLEGRIPTTFKNYRFLELLDLSHNKLGGEIPKEVVGLASLSVYLNLSHNSFVGSLPQEVSSLKNLAALDVSDNGLFGEIPASLDECQVLEYLFMQGNSFNGSIPSLSKLRGLQVMDFSRNQFSGAIPEFLQSLPYLRLLNLSFNNFSGEVPKGGVFQNVTIDSIVGNLELCGGDAKLHLPRCPIQASKNKHGPHKLTIIIIVLTASVSCFVVLFMFTRCPWILSSRKESLPLPAPSGIHHVRISYSELLKATNGFSRENLLGQGSFGSVYKGTLLDDAEKLVAVKVLNLQQHRASKSFMVECEALRNIRHRNLLKIITSCSSLDYQGNEFKALVFEFMANGSVEGWLHPKESASTMPSKLNFLQRLNIAIDVAFALDYLHNHVEAPIVHCDLKPSNILLDADMCAHVGDFGLSRFILEDGREWSKNLTSSNGIKGSIGYIAPEYGFGSQPSTSGDVYSYGILLLEMFTGQRPTCELFQDGLNIHKYVEMAFPARVMDVVEPCLLLYDEYGGANYNIQDVDNIKERLQECLVSIIKLGLLCSKESPEERMAMSDVINEVSIIRDVFFGIRT